MTTLTSSSNGLSTDKVTFPDSFSSVFSKRRDISWLIIVIQSAIILLTLTAFVVYVMSDRSKNAALLTSTQSSTLVVETSSKVGITTSTKSKESESESESSESEEDEDIKGIGRGGRVRPTATKFRKAAVVSDSGICSQLGRRILIRGGNAVDAAISTLLCVGVTNPQSSGIGGGFLMLFYRRIEGLCYSLNARETAPVMADEKMYAEDRSASSYGYKSIGVPGEIGGLWRAYSDWGSGRVEWKDLLMPIVQLCREGIPVSRELSSILQKERTTIMRDASLREMFTNETTTRLYEEGDIMHRVALADTLESLAVSKDPSALFYEGDLGQTIVREMNERGGLLRSSDLLDYEPLSTRSIASPLSDHLLLCGPPPPSSWIIAQLTVNIIKELYPHPRKEDLQTREFHNHLKEAEKYANAMKSHLGDPYYVKGMEDWTRNLSDPLTAKIIAAKIKDRIYIDNAFATDDYESIGPGSSHISIIDEEGNAVSLTSSLNGWSGPHGAPAELREQGQVDLRDHRHLLLIGLRWGIAARTGRSVHQVTMPLLSSDLPSIHHHYQPQSSSSLSASASSAFRWAPMLVIDVTSSDDGVWLGFFVPKWFEYTDIVLLPRMITILTAASRTVCSRNRLRFTAPASRDGHDGGLRQVSDVAANTEEKSSRALLGARVASSLGIIWNNEMDRFSITGKTTDSVSVNNFVEPGKSAITNMSPTIVVDEKDKKVRRVVGSSGGSDILQTLTRILLHCLYIDHATGNQTELSHSYTEQRPPFVRFGEDLNSSIPQNLRSNWIDSRSDNSTNTHSLVVSNDGYIHAYGNQRDNSFPDGY